MRTLEREDLVFVADGDVPAPDAVLASFRAKMEETGADVVVGVVRRGFILNRLYYAFVRNFLGVPLTGTQAGIRLFRRAAYDYARARALAKSGAYELELLVIAAGHGAKIVEMDVATDAKTVRRDMILRDTLAVFYRARMLGYYERCLVPRPLAKPPRVSVVIACPKPSWMLDECLAGLKAQTYGDWEAIVLPDGTDGEGSPRTPPAESANSFTPRTPPVELGKIRYLPTGKVRPAEKRNIGIRAATGEIIAFIDDDAYPDPHWIENAVKYFGEPSIGGVGGPGVTPPGDRLLAKIGGRVYDNLLVSGNYRYRYKAGGVRMDTEDYPSCNLFVRKDLLEEIGGYRTDFWPGEDTLLCKDIVDRWKRIVYDPWIVVYHHRRPLFLPHLRQLGRYGFHRGYFCKRFPSNSLRLSYFIPTAFVAYLAALAATVALAGLSPLVAGVAVLPLALYAALVALTTFAWRPHVWLLTGLGVFASHVCYGIRFMQGLLARRAPCEFIGRDHGTAKGART